MKLAIMIMSQEEGHATATIERSDVEAVSKVLADPARMCVIAGRHVRTYNELLEATAPYEGRVETLEMYQLPKMVGG